MKKVKRGRERERREREGGEMEERWRGEERGEERGILIIIIG